MIIGSKKLLIGLAASLALQTSANCMAAVDSYRYLHVTIETPWSIFLVLLPMVLAPLVLMAVLVWRYTERKVETEDEPGAVQDRKE